MKPIKNRFAALLICLLLLFIFYPFVKGKVFGVSVIDIFIFGIFLSSTYAIIERRKYFLIAIALASLAILAKASTYFSGHIGYSALYYASSALFLTFIGTVILANVLRAEKVTTDKIFGAICVYFLLGLVWGEIYALMEIFNPGTFTSAAAAGAGGAPVYESMSHLVYFSFTTLTTLGYGDITPTIPSARSLAALEAVTGQIYIATLVARLVALQITHSGKRE